MRISCKVLMALVMSLAMVAVCAASADAAWNYNFGIRNIPAGQYFVIKDFMAQEDAGLSYNVTVINGPNFDVLLFDKQNFDIYKSGGITFQYLPASRLDKSYAYADTGFGGLSIGAEYYLVIDNTDRPMGGADPHGQDVQVSFEVGAVNIQTVTDWSLVLIILGVVAVVAIVIVVFVIFLLRSSKVKGQVGSQAPYGQPYQQPGMKTCPRCGVQVPGEFAFCPRCGHRY